MAKAMSVTPHFMCVSLHKEILEEYIKKKLIKMILNL